MDFRYKQVIVVRADLKMGKGKIAAQAGHAAVSASEEAKRRFRDWWDSWLAEGQSKVAVKVSSLEKLLDLEASAKKLDLPLALITDRGLTQLEPGTTTCLAIGPAPAEVVDRLTGNLKLL